MRFTLHLQVTKTYGETIHSLHYCNISLANANIWLLRFSELRVARFQRAFMHKKGNSECSNITPVGQPMLIFCPLDPLSFL